MLYEVITDGAVPAAGENIDFLSIDQPFGLGDTLFRLGLGIGIDKLQLCPTKGLDAAGGVDLFHGHLTGVLALLADGR